MAKMETKGLDEVNKTLNRLGTAGKGLAKMAVYVGADVIADEVRKTTEALRVSEPGRRKDTRKIYASVTDVEKKQLLQSLGIVKIQYEDGAWQTSIGFAGYGGRKTKAYPRGLPNALLARSVSKPSALRKGSRFTANALKRAQGRAVAEMARTVDEGITKIIAE